jgi:molybdopterin-guanine dinucleotide biosynthesis protein B
LLSGDIRDVRLIGLAGWSGAGKTTLMTRLIPEMTRRGIGVSTLKHAHHAFDVDRPGKDSYEHRSAGARQVLVASANRWALMTELRGAPEPQLGDLLRQLDPVDLIVVEGFKRDAHPKIEVHRAENAKPWLHPDDPYIAAIASDIAPPATGLPRAHLDDIGAIADLVLAKATPLEEFLARV